MLRVKHDIQIIESVAVYLASHAGVFRGARISSAFVGREEIRARLKTLAWEATVYFDC